MNQNEKRSKKLLPGKNPQRNKRGKNRLSYLVLIGVLAAGAIGVWWIKSACFARTIRFDLRSRDVAKKFIASHDQWRENTAGGVRLTCLESCYVLSPPIASTWEEYPYLKVQWTDLGADSAFIFWLADKSREANGIRLINPLPSRAMRIASAKSFHPWIRQMPWQGDIDQVGIRISPGSILIPEIVLTDSLTPWEWAKLGILELRSIEPFMAYAINIIWGASIDGWSLTTLGGVLVVIALLAALYGSSCRAANVLAGIAVVLILIVDIPFLINLVRTSADASAMSAWRGSLQEEEASRFGVEFAEIARILRREAPAGSSVFVPNRNRQGVSLESEPFIFELWPQYKPAGQINRADYIILLRPQNARYDAREGVIILPDHAPVPAVPVAILNPEAMLLKRKI